MLNENNMALIRRSPLFSGLTDSEFDYALTFFNAKEEHYAKGAFLKQAHEPLSLFGLVLEGLIQVYIDDFDGQQMIMASVTPGSTFGESLSFLGREEPIYICSGEPSTLLWLSPKRLHIPQSELDHRLSNRFTHMLAERALQMNNRIQILSKLSIREKVITYLSQLALLNASREFDIPLSREDMALYLGVNRSALSRELSQMQIEGIIALHRSSIKILIKDPLCQ